MRLLIKARSPSESSEYFPGNKIIEIAKRDMISEIFYALVDEIRSVFQ